MFDKTLFKANVLMAGKTYQDVADLLGISLSALYVRIRNGDFSREEIQKITDFLGMDSPLEVFFAKKLTHTQNEQETV